MRFKQLATMIWGLLFAGAALAQAPVATATPAPTATPPLEAVNTLYLDLSTGGRVTIQLRPDKAPQSVERIKALVRRGFYDGLTFHRVIEGFMAQTGDPKGDGSGGSELADLKAEFNDLPHVRGVMSMARAEDVNSANSQFFIMLSPNLRLDGKYSAIGRVVSGMAYVDAIERGEPPANPSKIVKASLAQDAGPAPAAAAPAAGDAAAAAAANAAAQAADSAIAADDSANAAKSGDRATATERAEAAKVSAEGAAEAAKDAAEAADQAAKADAPPQE
ncbi:peptidylprolyl isomerase [Sphingomonas sp. 1P06PA]